MGRQPVSIRGLSSRCRFAFIRVGQQFHAVSTPQCLPASACRRRGTCRARCYPAGSAGLRKNDTDLRLAPRGLALPFRRVWRGRYGIGQSAAHGTASTFEKSIDRRCQGASRRRTWSVVPENTQRRCCPFCSGWQKLCSSPYSGATGAGGFPTLCPRRPAVLPSRSTGRGGATTGAKQLQLCGVGADRIQGGGGTCRPNDGLGVGV